MKKLFFRFIAFVVSLLGVFSSCGMYAAALYSSPTLRKAYGLVKNKSGNPIPGIKVSKQNETSVETADNGSWILYDVMNGETLTFSDIDGAENGSYKQKNHILTWDEIDSETNIEIVLESK